MDKELNNFNRKFNSKEEDKALIHEDNWLNKYVAKELKKN